MTPIEVQIIGAPLACADGVKDTWREVARHAADQLSARFGDRVHVQYFDLFDADCPALPHPRRSLRLGSSAACARWIGYRKASKMCTRSRSSCGVPAM